MSRDLSEWKTGSARTMQKMFASTTTFNGDLRKWDTSKLLNAANMFDGATAFAANGLPFWDISSVTKLNSFISNSGITPCNKRKIADVWSNESTLIGLDT